MPLSFKLRRRAFPKAAFSRAAGFSAGNILKCRLRILFPVDFCGAKNSCDSARERANAEVAFLRLSGMSANFLGAFAFDVLNVGYPLLSVSRVFRLFLCTFQAARKVGISNLYGCRPAAG